MVGLGTNGVQHAAPDMKLSCDDDLLCKVVDHGKMIVTEALLFNSRNTGALH